MFQDVVKLTSGKSEQPAVKTVCLVIHSLQAGGMERVMAELANYFAGKRELRVVLILYGIRRDIFYPIADNIEIHRPPFSFKAKLRFLSSIRTVWFLRREVQKIRPQCILSFGEYWNNFVLLATYGLQVPVYVSDRSQPDKSLGGFHNLLRRFLYPRAAGVIAQTAKARQIFLGMYDPQRIAVIANPIRRINMLGTTLRQNSVLMVGRLIRSKNQEKLISIFLKIKMTGWKLVLVGYDHLRQQNLERLKSMVRELGGEDSVVFAGKQANVDEFYRTSKIFAFTSLSEGFPNVIGEAMSAGLPVVAFDCVAGPAEMIISGQNGFLIPLDDDNLFAEKLSLLMRDESLRIKMGMIAQESIRRFSINRIGEEFLRFMNVSCPGQTTGVIDT